jgi:hypothetical protein
MTDEAEEEFLFGLATIFGAYDYDDGDTLYPEDRHMVRRMYSTVLKHVRDSLLARTLTIKDMRFVLDRTIERLEK